jgi:hypothetical protein
MDLQASVREIDDPILRDAGLGVQAGLALPIVR